MYIESVQNPRVKAWAKLKTRKGRIAAGCFLVEGVRLVDEVLRSALVVDALLCDVSAPEPPQDLLDAAANRGVPVYELAPRPFAEVADTVTPQGVIAVTRMPDPPAESPGPWTLLLDDVRDPGNAGTLVRCADAFGVGDVVFADGTVDAYHPKVVRASMGGLFRTRVREMPTAAALEAWRKRWPDGQVVLADATAEVDCTQADWRRPTLLVIGGEARGAGETARRGAALTVRIPMEPAAESLNAAMAGVILMYEGYRQRVSRG
ncbi:MAG: RNA methyltransferase [Thermoflavifilum sp.]|nr:RNA methyltransferase [Thermoflavifilum sp.]MCL6512787.1 RNA methyltransferase [Alicyclobacillus sp.]